MVQWTGARARNERIEPEHLSLATAFSKFLEQVKATRTEVTWSCYRSDLRWVETRLRRNTVAEVTREDPLRYFG